MAFFMGAGKLSAYTSVADRFSKSKTGAKIFFTSADFSFASGLWKRISMFVPVVGRISPFEIGDVCWPIPICTRSYQCFPLFRPPLPSSTILSSSRLTLVICTRSPRRAAGPISFPMSSHFLLSKEPADSYSRGFLDRGRKTLTVAYSKLKPRISSTRSSYVSLSALRKGTGRPASASVSTAPVRGRISFLHGFVQQQIRLRPHRSLPQKRPKQQQNHGSHNARLGTILAARPERSGLPLHLVTRHSYF